jgi:hypothetical protein
MSHTIQFGQRANLLLPTIVTIADYVAGGETITLAEIQAASVAGFLLGNIPPSQNSLGVTLFPISQNSLGVTLFPISQNSLGVTLFPIFQNGKALLFRISAGVFSEIPSTVGLNATLVALIFVTQ